MELLLLGTLFLAFALIVLARIWVLGSEKYQAIAPRNASSRAHNYDDSILPAHIGKPLEELTSAVSTYGAHLQSHTSIISRMASSSEGLGEAVQRQNTILAELALVVREMKIQQSRS